MRYKVHYDAEYIPTYEVGSYYWDKSTGEVFRIIIDEDKGFALLNVSIGRIDSSFYERMVDFLDSTSVTRMKKLNQINDAEFKEE